MLGRTIDDSFELFDAEKLSPSVDHETSVGKSGLILDRGPGQDSQTSRSGAGVVPPDGLGKSLEPVTNSVERFANYSYLQKETAYGQKATLEKEF